MTQSPGYYKIDKLTVYKDWDFDLLGAVGRGPKWDKVPIQHIDGNTNLAMHEFDRGYARMNLS
jgi:hypothetical protein